MGLYEKFLGILAYYMVSPYTTYLHKHRGVRFTDASSVFIGSNVTIDRTYPEFVTIGENVMISPGTSLIAHSSPPTSMKERFLPAARDEVTIGDNVYVGGDPTIFPGVTINDWSVVGAGSVVMKDVPKYKIVAGNPAETIGDLREK